MSKKVSLVILIVAVLLLAGYFQQRRLVENYLRQASFLVEDRQGKIISLRPNYRGYYNYPLKEIPSSLKELLVQKEDRFFYRHFGVNPVSLLGNLLGQREASSTITQQLAKILLGHEQERSLANKLEETLAAFSLEFFQGKERILTMYANSIYFGQRAQGVFEASRLYFNSSPEMLSQGEFLQLLAAVSSPSENNPAQESNVSLALVLSQRLRKENLVFVSAVQVRANLGKSKSSWSLFELERFFSKKQGFCRVSLDESLNERVREIVRKTLQELQSKSVGNAAAIVLKLPENEVLSLVGSPDPFSSVSGRQIDMLLEPRPIGSTIKPFIYLKAFEKGLRPYTLVDDREYKYITALGFPLYPKNYDYQYRGLVSLHYALSNSLNVPAVKTLEYAGLEDFYRFWQGVGFNPLRPWAEYQLGVALGGLEMSLFDLASSFTLFPNNGRLKPVKIFQAGDCLEPELTGREITEPGYIQLVNRVLNDRQTGMDQFGRKSELNLFQNNYALKTGTSRDFRDSWVVGYTPDFLVGVWAGNADNSPTDQVSGQEGAGLIFSQIMELLFNSAYNKKTAFDFSLLKDYQAGQTLDWGLPGDDYEKVRNLLLASDTSLILLPHDNDTFVLEVNTKIILRAKETVSWFVDNEFLTQGKEAIFAPDRSGAYQILARSSDQSEAVTIVVDN